MRFSLRQLEVFLAMTYFQTLMISKAKHEI